VIHIAENFPKRENSSSLNCSIEAKHALGKKLVKFKRSAVKIDTLRDD